jgi:hypothetical protein
MRLAWLVIGICAQLAAGCLSSEQDRSDASGEGSEAPLSQVPIVRVESGETLLDCRDPAGPTAHVDFECDSVTVYACATMTEAVIEYESGARQRFVALRAQTGTFTGQGAHEGQRIVSVAIDTALPAGTAVLTQHFDAPADSCGAALSAR